MPPAARPVDTAGPEYGFGKRGVRGLLVVLGLALGTGLCALLLFGGAASGVAALPEGFTQARVVAGLESPTTMEFAPDGRFILRLDNLSGQTNHNGGAIHFGEDGKLYVAVGENANPDNAQSLRNLLGKMLRINKDGTIPKDNPYFANDSVVGKDKAIWARGLRNPYSFAVQPGTGRIHINDVGADTWEEINRGARGANYGWPREEGPESKSAFTPPIFAYQHEGSPNTTGCAITGGAFYNPRGVQFPAGYVGDYFFADFCGGWIRRYDRATDTASGFATGLDRPVDLKVSSSGALFYLDRMDGEIWRIQHPG